MCVYVFHCMLCLITGYAEFIRQMCLLRAGRVPLLPNVKRITKLPNVHQRDYQFSLFHLQSVCLGTTGHSYSSKYSGTLIHEGCPSVKAGDLDPWPPRRFIVCINGWPFFIFRVRLKILPVIHGINRALLQSWAFIRSQEMPKLH